MKWYMPSWNGDFRLEPHTVPGNESGLRKPGSAPLLQSKLVLFKPTLGERELLAKFLETAREKGWTETTEIADTDESEILLQTEIADAGEVLVKLLKPKDRTITAVAFRDGKVQVAETAGAKALVQQGTKEKAKAAASVERPTPCCPNCMPGAIEPATEVLLSFLTPEEHRQWADRRQIVVHGGVTGHRYLLAHRHTETARRITRVCFDLDDQCVVHFHQHDVPPEEEVLAAKLVLEHREPWLRNEATMLEGAPRDVFKNPFGDYLDGVTDAKITKAFGGFVLGFMGAKGKLS